MPNKKGAEQGPGSEKKNRGGGPRLRRRERIVAALAAFFLKSPPPVDTVPLTDEQAMAAATVTMAIYTKWVAFATVASVLTAGFTAWLIWSQLDDTRRAFRIDERPWVQIGRIESEPSSSGDPALYVFRIYLQNAGKTAAYDISAQIVAASGTGAYRADHVRRVMESTFSGDTSLKDARGRPLAPVERDEAVPQSLAPLSTATAPLVGPAIETAPFPQGSAVSGSDLDKMPISMLLGKVRYSDTFRVAHWTTFCLVIVKGGKTIPCLAGNETDRDY